MTEGPPFKVDDDLPAIMTMRYPEAKIAICPDCWGRGEIVPFLLEVGGTISFVLPDRTEVQRLAGSYLFCVRCSWSEMRGHMADPPRSELGGGEGDER